jgi:hypothetical protein
VRFGRVDGHIILRDGALLLTVTLEQGRDLEVVREGAVPALREIGGVDDLDWHADQYTQETIGVDLAELGWEVFAEGLGDLETASDGAGVDGIGRSRRYIVRRPVDPWSEQHG